MHKSNYAFHYFSKPADPCLIFGPFAWLKLQFLCRKATTEIGAFGIALDPKEPLTIHDLVVPKQTCTVATVDLDMDDLSEKYEVLFGSGLEPYQYSSVWIHTHPGDSAAPSSTDEQTFAARTGPWSVMFILAKGGATSCRLKVRSEGSLLSLEKELAVQINWNVFHPADPLGEFAKQWTEQLVTCVNEPKFIFTSHPKAQRIGFAPTEIDRGYEAWYLEKERLAAEEERELRELCGGDV